MKWRKHRSAGFQSAPGAGILPAPPAGSETLPAYAGKMPALRVRSEVDLCGDEIRFYRLRRREPDQQPLIKTIPYQPPDGPFQG